MLNTTQLQRCCLPLLAMLLSAGSAVGQVFSSAPNVIIPDTPTLTNTINVSGGPTNITSVRVVLKVRHTYDSDLDIALVRGNKYLRLSSANGFDGDDYLTTRFTDAGPQYIYDGLSPFNGNFKPEGGVLVPEGATTALPGTPVANLAAFNGTDSAGPWTLWIDDAGDGDTGRLVYWSLEFNGVLDVNGPFGTNPPPPPPPTWFEAGDAGELPGTAQRCTGSGPLARISGTLDDGNTDMYAINICDPASFSATTVNATAIDSQLFLFNSAGRGVTFDDDAG